MVRYIHVSFRRITFIHMFFILNAESRILIERENKRRERQVNIPSVDDTLLNNFQHYQAKIKNLNQNGNEYNFDFSFGWIGWVASFFHV